MYRKRLTRRIAPVWVYSKDWDLYQKKKKKKKKKKKTLKWSRWVQALLGKKWRDNIAERSFSRTPKTHSLIYMTLLLLNPWTQCCDSSHEQSSRQDLCTEVWIMDNSLSSSRDTKRVIDLLYTFTKGLTIQMSILYLSFNVTFPNWHFYLNSDFHSNTQ